MDVKMRIIGHTKDLIAITLALANCLMHSLFPIPSSEMPMIDCKINSQNFCFPPIK